MRSNKNATKNVKVTSTKNKSQNVSNAKKKTAKKETSRIGFLLFSVVLFLVILISTIFSDVQQIIYNKNKTEELRIKYTELLEEEASLNSEVTKLQDPEYKARYAREKYMYTKDGEKILTIIESDISKKEENKDE